MNAKLRQQNRQRNETFCPRTVILAFTLHSRVDATIQVCTDRELRTAKDWGLWTEDSRLRTQDSELGSSELATQDVDSGFPLAFCAHKIDLNFYCDKKLFEKWKETRAQSAQSTRAFQMCSGGRQAVGCVWWAWLALYQTWWRAAACKCSRRRC